MISRTLVAGVAGLSAISLACGGGGGTTTTSRTVGPQPIEQRVTTNVPELNQALNTALSGDSIEMARLTGYQRVACANEPAPPNAPPQCRGDEPDGTPVEVFAIIACDGTVNWVRPEDVPDSFKFSLGTRAVDLDAVYAPTPATTHFDAQYVAVIKNGEREGGRTGAIAVYFHTGRIVAIEDDCGEIARLLAAPRVASYVVSPTSVAGTPTATP